MRRDALASLWVAAALAAALIAGGCGGSERPLRIGVVADCVGAFRTLEGAQLSGAELPLIERGARLRRRAAADGISSVRVAGRPVELVRGCTEFAEYSILTAELRRLIEEEHVDAVVAGSFGPDQVVMREVARRHPRVVVVPVAHGPREVTLRRPSANLYRVAADYGQGVAGLATYAYRHLGWRRAAVVVADWDRGWGQRDAFVAEFCALGGRVPSQLALAAFDPQGEDVVRIPEGVDGVAVFAPAVFGPTGFLARLAVRLGDPGRRLVVGPEIVDDPALLGAAAGALRGVTGSSHLPATGDGPALRAYVRSYRRAFRGSPESAARSESTIGYRNAVEAVVRAFERADGEVERLGPELGRLRTELLDVPVRLDANRQAVASTTLVRLAGATTPPAAPTAVRTIPGVDQSVGSLLDAGRSPSAAPATCRRAPPPAWAR